MKRAKSESPEPCSTDILPPEAKRSKILFHEKDYVYSLLDLSDDVLLHIFKYLSSFDLMSLHLYVYLSYIITISYTYCVDFVLFNYTSAKFCNTMKLPPFRCCTRLHDLCCDRTLWRIVDLRAQHLPLEELNKYMEFVQPVTKIVAIRGNKRKSEFPELHPSFLNTVTLKCENLHDLILEDYSILQEKVI